MADAPSDPVSVVFLAFNEAGSIRQEVRSFHEAIVRRIPGSELIVAEDGSTDGTSEILQELHRQGVLFHLTSRERKGYRKAFLEAVGRAKSEFIFFSDTGLKHDPLDFWNMYPLRHEYDMIVGRKTNRRDQLYRRLFTRGYNLLIRTYFGVPQVHDCDSGFKLFNRAVVERVFKSDKLFFKELASSEIVLRLIHSGLRYGEVPVSYAQRQGVSRGLPPSKLPKVILSAVRNLVRLKSEFSRDASADSGIAAKF